MFSKLQTSVTNLFSGSPVCFVMMLLIALVSVISLYHKKYFFQFLLHPFGIVKNREYYRIFTFDLVHNDFLHLGLNLFMMWISCVPLETFLRQQSSYGTIMFLLIYAAAHFSGALYVTLRYRRDFEYSCAGASGSILGCLFSYMLLRPHIIAFYVPVIGGVQNNFTVLIYIALLIRLQFKNQTAYSNALHFFGALGGAVMTLILFPNVVKF